MQNEDIYTVLKIPANTEAVKTYLNKWFEYSLRIPNNRLSQKRIKFRLIVKRYPGSAKKQWQD